MAEVKKEDKYLPGNSTKAGNKLSLSTYLIRQISGLISVVSNCNKFEAASRII
ncbi:hypothetical protein [Adhaeribacter pallidiroseus]|uniref:hypothetical protein n=1 Tax=Adhaeribacter pallidiroseus TaxID=2072847 RepID=UPI001314D78F|nr:hypothetical protein [Adhaeribacter pallidiroseus]